MRQRPNAGRHVGALQGEPDGGVVVLAEGIKVEPLCGLVVVVGNCGVEWAGRLMRVCVYVDTYHIAGEADGVLLCVFFWEFVRESGGRG